MSETKQSAFKLPLKLGYAAVIADSENKTILGSYALSGMPKTPTSVERAEIVQAVNSLPLMREAEEALQAVYENSSLITISNHPEVMLKVQAVLSRLRAAREGKS